MNLLHVTTYLAERSSIYPRSIHTTPARFAFEMLPIMIRSHDVEYRARIPWPRWKFSGRKKTDPARQIGAYSNLYWHELKDYVITGVNYGQRFIHSDISIRRHRPKPWPIHFTWNTFNRIRRAHWE